MALVDDGFGNWYDDGTGSVYNTSSPTYTGAGEDNWGGWFSDPFTDSVENQAPPPGAVAKDSSGNWLDSLGNLISAVSPIAGPILSGLATPWINNLQSGGLQDKAIDMLRAGGSGIAGLRSPDLMSLIPVLQQQIQQGLMTPAQAQAALQQASEMSGVQSDAQSIGDSRAALDQLAEIGQNRGLTEADRAQFAALMNQANANAAQQRQAQIQQMQMQGNAGTGTELAARLSGVQGAANSNAAAGANMAQSAQQRALTALQQGVTGNLNLNSQMFDQAAKKAGAQDAVNQFNAAARNTINMNNSGLAQQANLANFNMANTIAGKNTDIVNQQRMLPINTANQQFKNNLDQMTNASRAQIEAGKGIGDMAKAQIERSGTASGVATPAGPAPAPAPSSGGNNTLSTIGKVVDIGSKIFGWFSDEDLKKDKKPLSDNEVDNMMADLTGYKYRYKGDSNNPQQQGVMAQDMEKGMGSVIDTPAGKMIQGDSALSKALAVIANQNDRIRKLEGK